MVQSSVLAVPLLLTLLGPAGILGVQFTPPDANNQPPPTPQPARSYLVYFGSNSMTLNDRARQVIKEAAANLSRLRYTRIEVIGYTDATGSPQYNIGLSVRRANAVKAELIHDGVSGEITTRGVGEDAAHMLVPHGPGVREAQNDRVEILSH
jgi:outer membrane protein OmpA-like peptidoglycan-associated protein